MNSKIMFTLFISSFLFSACLYRNCTKVKLDRCTAHNEHLKKRLVAMQYGYPDFGSALYPYKKGSISLGCERPAHRPLIRIARIYACDSCTRVWKQHWVRE